MASKPEIVRNARNLSAAKRRDAKRAAARLTRRAAKRDPENAPARVTRGWAN